MNLNVYRWATRLISPALWLWDTIRASKQPIYRPHRRERWAKHLPKPLAKPLIWIHAVSVGETQACAPLLRALLAQYPQHAVLLTHMTPTGRSIGALLFAQLISMQRVQQCYLPYDVAGLPERFLAHFRPVYGVFMETEIWPNHVAACGVMGIPLGLANARMSSNTLRKTQQMHTLACSTYNAFAWVAAQSGVDAQRFAHFRTKPITVIGNLKFDAQRNEAQWQQGQAFKRGLSTTNSANHSPRLTIALASTREGEELLLLTALKPLLASLAQPPLVLLIPRHPKRAGELIDVLKQLQLTFAQRSLGQIADEQTQVLLCDTLGEMWFYYGASDIAVVGGGWLAHGGQNLIEPCMAGCAVVVGEHMFNFAHATQLALDHGAVIQTDSTGLNEQVAALFDATRRSALVERSLAFSAKHTGATQRHMALLKGSI